MLKVNEYFDGGVKSISFEGESLPASVGVMAPGAYEFGTETRETMTVVSGELSVRLPAEDEFRTYAAGDQFVIGAGETFALRVERDAAYLCTYG